MQRRGIVTQRPTEKQWPQAGRVLCRAISQVGTVALESLRKQLRKSLKTRWQAWNWGWSRNWHGPGKRNAFLFILIPLIAPCCSQPSPIRTGSLCLIAKLSSSPPTSSLCPRYVVPYPNVIKITTRYDAR